MVHVLNNFQEWKAIKQINKEQKDLDRGEVKIKT